jgi:hypothetical protein
VVPAGGLEVGLHAGRVRRGAVLRGGKKALLDGVAAKGVLVDLQLMGDNAVLGVFAVMLVEGDGNGREQGDDHDHNHDLGQGKAWSGCRTFV